MKRIAAYLVAVTLAAGVAAPVVAQQAPKAARAAAQAANQNPDQPRIVGMRPLNNAKRALEKQTGPDAGGHRAKALQYINGAIMELQAGNAGK